MGFWKPEIKRHLEAQRRAVSLPIHPCHKSESLYLPDRVLQPPPLLSAGRSDSDDSYVL